MKHETPGFFVGIGYGLNINVTELVSLGLEAHLRYLTEVVRSYEFNANVAVIFRFGESWTKDSKGMDEPGDDTKEKAGG